MIVVPYKIKKIRVGTQLVRPTVPATAITLDKSSIKLSTAGQTSQITATLTPADSTSTVSWTSSNTSIATVSSTGLVTCVTPGTCTITATTNNGLTASCSVMEGGYTPGAYTVAYFPLKIDLLDHGPNQYSMTNLGGVTINTSQAVGKGVAYFNGSSRLYKTDISSGLPLSTNPKTMSLWVKHISGITYCGFGRMYTGYNNQSFILCGVSGRLGFSTWGGGYDYASSITPSSSQWYHCAVSYNGTTWIHYVNGTQVNSGNLSINASGTTLCLGADADTRSGWENYFTGYLSDVIIENRTWSATDVTNYYNDTKSFYGIS